MMRTLLFLTVVYMFQLCFGQAENCASGRHGLRLFGPSCEYICHCEGQQCDRNTGVCPGNTKCGSEWIGSGCQYINIAKGGTVSSNYLLNTLGIVDGNKDTCLYQHQNTYNFLYLAIGFGRTVKITEVHVIFQSAENVQPFRVNIVGINTTSVCGSVSEINGQNMFIVRCDSQLDGHSINITFEGSDAEFIICEVQVPAGRNVGYGKPASQSSTIWQADQAVDGDTRYDPPSEDTCSHTMQSSNPWWFLDLEEKVKIQWFRIFNRKDDNIDKTLNERLKNFRIFLSQDNLTFDEYYQDTSMNPDLIIIPGLKPDVIARYVIIDLQGETRILTLCEVQIFGDCEDGKYGNCQNICNYCPNQSCDKLTGYCRECGPGRFGNRCNELCDYCYQGHCFQNTGACIACPPGKQGERCEQACADHYYGNCSIPCGNCRDFTVCDKVNGSCPSGRCSEGWDGQKCDIKCNETYHGQNCESKCGHCLNGTCDRFTGNCSKDAGCQLGWQGSRCDIACDDAYYGNCTTRCGNCRDSAICNKVNGSCPLSLCTEGWYGEKCDTMCDSKHYGQNCAYECGRCLNGTCDRIMGNCSETSGCQPGWHGSRCDLAIGLTVNQRSNNPIEPSILGGSIGGAVAIIGIIIAIVIIIIVKRRRHKRSPSTAEKTRYLSRKNDGLVYENSTFVNTGDDMQPNHGMSKESNKGISPTMPNQAKTATKLNTEDPEIYYNVGRALPAGAVELSMFWDYVQEKFLDERFLPKEFEKLPTGLQFPTTVALRPENRNKNRYKQLYAYDVNRVTLKPMGDDSSDYINASFIDGYSRQKTYIASQGTTKENINDFWRMLWQYHVGKIVMLTELFEGGRHKCEQYWPEEEGQTSTFGSVVVKLLATDVFADYNIRILEMSVGKKSKQLTQFHFTAWPDKGVPKATSSIVQFWKTVNKVTAKEPVVVHCSAGIGRTGTYIALDYLVSQGKAEEQVNVSACVSNLRRQRVNLVQTQEQYLFLHETLLEALMLSGTAIASDTFPKVYSELLEFDPVNRKLKLQLEYERMQNEVGNHEAVYATIKMDDEEGGEMNSDQDEFSAAKHIENRAKNRHDNILPADRHRIFLNRPVSGRNDYINAVVLPSHKQRKAFIMTQMPLTDTVIDFWRMINDFEIKTIIMFNSESSKTDNIGIYWPKEGETRYGPFSVRLQKQEICTIYIERTLTFSLIGEDHDRSVKQFQFTNWDENSNVPGSTDSVLQLLCDVETWQKEMEAQPVVVHCLNGAQRSGLYCVISTVIERLKVERDVAITQTIKRMRAIRQQIIPNYEQFQFCHECILQYMKTFETYSNF